MQTVTLTERQSSTVKLSQQELAFLQREHPHLRVVPSRSGRRARITPTHLVGVISGPSVRYIIKPKLPFQRLMYLLDPEQKQTGAQPGSNAHDPVRYLAEHLLTLAESRQQAGFHRGYVTHSSHGTRLEGSLDVQAQVRAAGNPQPQIYSHYENLSLDINCNQILRQALEILIATEQLQERQTARVSSLLTDLATVSNKPVRETDIAHELECPPCGYFPLLQVCELIIQSSLPGEHSRTAPAFLIDLEKIFERYVTRGITQYLAEAPGSVCIPQAWVTLATGATEVMGRPDLLIQADERSRMSVDVKWKLLRNSGPIPADFYQILSYCACIGVKTGYLIYPAKAPRSLQYEVSAGGIRIEAHTLVVAGSEESCRTSMESLGEKIGQELSRT